MPDTQPQITFDGFTPEALGSLLVPGVAERWAAVQERLHPALAALAEQIHAEGARRLGPGWQLYEVSFKSQRFVNRGAGARAPIDEYHLAIDRPPRGAGVYVAVSGAERLVLVALQLWGARKADLRRVWEEGRVVWQPLVERMTEVRFAERRRRDVGAGGRVDADSDAGESPRAMLWLDRYLAAPAASYLLAGFAYPWGERRVSQPEFAAQIVEDVLALLPLNEAIMEQAEQRAPTGAALLREQRAAYTPGTPPVEEIVERVHARGFALPAALIRAYHLALQTKPLVILPGISGTGKTRLTRLYADAVYGLGERDENEHYLLVSVQPDWHNARDLLGYYNAITGRFHATPFLRFLQRAASDPHAPYYVCLDEMNLARPEYYLAPILSALETDDRLIDLGAPGATVEAVTGEALQNPFRLPLNVALTGTVNVDESTHALSDKLLDRANVIELTDVDLAAFRRSWRGPVDEEVWRALVDVHAILARAGQPFGYRTVAEILRYLERARGVMSPEAALDQQVKQKILPKLRGEDSPRLRRALTALIERLDAASFPESSEKLSRMLERLEADGFTDFYG